MFNIELKKATLNDAELIWKMQIKAFADLLKKYQDYDTSPANEPIDKVISRLKQEFTYYYIICADKEVVGAIRVVDMGNEHRKRISPVFILKEYRGKGIAQRSIRLVESMHGEENWELDTILQEKGNCYLYEKMGYICTGKTEKINDKMTLVFYIKN